MALAQGTMLELWLHPQEGGAVTCEQQANGSWSSAYKLLRNSKILLRAESCPLMSTHTVKGSLVFRGQYKKEVTPWYPEGQA